MAITHVTKYGGSNQSITITIASLASAAARAGVAIDNSVDAALALDALVQVQVKTGAGAQAGLKGLNVYAYATVDPNGPTYPEGITGADAGITLTSPTNLKQIGFLSTPSASTQYTSEPMSVAAAFGGILPAKWGIVLENQTGQTLDAAGGSHKAIYQTVFASSQ